MASSVSASSVVLSRYVGALADLAEKKGALEKVQQDMMDIAAMLAGSEDLRLMVSSPRIGAVAQARAVESLSKAAKFDRLTVNFLNVLVQNRRLNALGGIVKAFQKEVSRRRGEVTVRVETAMPLTGKQEEAFRDKISAALGVGVQIETAVDPDILGGMIVTVGSHMVDDSVRRKLERLGSALVKGANQNTVQNLKEVG